MHNYRGKSIGRKTTGRVTRYIVDRGTAISVTMGRRIPIIPLIGNPFTKRIIPPVGLMLVVVRIDEDLMKSTTDRDGGYFLDLNNSVSCRSDYFAAINPVYPHIQSIGYIASGGP